MQATLLFDEARSGRPFLKWAGGKRQLLPVLLAHVPRPVPRFIEPFVGGGALFFELRPREALLADVNERLIRSYRGVRDHVEDVIALLKGYPHDEAFFYELRAIDVDARTDAEVAAWFISSQPNGLQRPLSRQPPQSLNVPFGRYVRPTICDESTLRSCSRALARAELLVTDFAEAAATARPGDVVYFDPPYVPLSVTSSFTSYTSGGFGAEDQRRLRDVALELKRRGVNVLLSNSSAPFVRELYAEGFDVTEVSATRLVNSKVSGRGAVVELVIR